MSIADICLLIKKREVGPLFSNINSYSSLNFLRVLLLDQVISRFLLFLSGQCVYDPSQIKRFVVHLENVDQVYFLS